MCFLMCPRVALCVCVCARTLFSPGSSGTFPCVSGPSCPGGTASHPSTPAQGKVGPLPSSETVSAYSLAEGGEGWEPPLGPGSQDAGLLEGWLTCCLGPAGGSANRQYHAWGLGWEQVAEDVRQLLSLCGFFHTQGKLEAPGCFGGLEQRTGVCVWPG